MSASQTADGVADVVIVGDGPVGATLAVLLAQRGRRVVVVERWPEPYPLPRAVHIDDHSARVLQACGIGGGLASITEPAPVYEWRNGAGTPLLRLGRAGMGPSGWPASSMFHQPALEGLLADRAGQLGVEVRRGEEVSGVDQDPGGVVVTTSEGRTVTARWAVGCDGANSTVRALTGVAVHDLGFFYDWLIVDVVLDHERVFDPVNLQVCDPSRPTTAVSGGPGRRRWEFMRLPGEAPAGLAAPERAWELLAPWDVHPGNATIERQALYTFAARYAEAWRAGRVLLAGDAAHQMPPFAGQGLCAGIRDAANLAWKLDLVLAGFPDALLDAYQAERRPEVSQAIEFSMELGRLICVPDPAEAAARDEAMAATVGDEPSDVPARPPLAGGVVGPSAHAGQDFPQGRVGDARFDDLHGTGWRLVTTPAVTLDDGLARWFGGIDGAVVSVDPDDTVLRGWFDEHRCAAALVRPDFAVYGTAADPAEVGPLVAGLRDHLVRPGGRALPVPDP